MTITTVTFVGTGNADQTFIVPGGVTSLEVSMRGSPGQGGGGAGPGGTTQGLGGRGARWVGTIPVTPAETLTLQVGNRLAGGIPDGTGRGRLNYPDGARGGAITGSSGSIGPGGGGSSRIWRSGVGGTLLVIAGGGGGGPHRIGTTTMGTQGGDAGIPTGATAGANGTSTPTAVTATGGSGATVLAGGGAGNPGTNQVPIAGASLLGGYGGARTASSFGTFIIGGGGGGGGLFGGGGGGVVGSEVPPTTSHSVGAGGGGGSSFADAALTTTTTWALGGYSDLGIISITYDDTPVVPVVPGGWVLGIQWTPKIAVTPGSTLVGPYLLYDIRHWTAGALVNEGSLGAAWNIPLSSLGSWSMFVNPHTPGMATFGGAPSTLPFTFLVKAAATIDTTKQAYANIAFYSRVSGSFSKYIELEADPRSATSTFVQGDSTTASVANDMDIVYSNVGPGVLFPNALFFITVDFADPLAGLHLWRNGVDETLGAHISTRHYGTVATPAYIDALFTGAIDMYLEFTSVDPLVRNLKAMAMFRGIPTAADFAYWLTYF